MNKNQIAILEVAIESYISLRTRIKEMRESSFTFSQALTEMKKYPTFEVVEEDEEEEYVIFNYRNMNLVLLWTDFSVELSDEIYINYLGFEIDCDVREMLDHVIDFYMRKINDTTREYTDMPNVCAYTDRLTEDVVAHSIKLKHFVELLNEERMANY